MAKEQEPKFQIPEVETPKLRTNRNDHLIPGSNEKDPGLLMRSPGHLSIYTATHKGLVSVSQMRGQAVTKVENVRAANFEDDPRLWLYPTDANDPDRIPVNHDQSKITINLSTVLKNWKMALPTGQSRTYDVHLDPKSPVGPALVIYMDKPLEIKWQKRSQKKQETPAQQVAPTTQPEAPKSEAPNTDAPNTDAPKTEPANEN